MNTSDPFLEYFGGDIIWKKWQRNFRRFISINPQSRRTIKNFKSLTVVKAETLRHLLFYRNRIHCFSRFRHFWEILMMLTYGLAFIVIPLDAAFLFGRKRLENTTMWEITSAIDVICLIDIAINFLSCYQDSQTKKIVMDRQEIAWNYFRRYFWIDILSSVPDRYILMIFFSDFDLVNGNDINECLNVSANPFSLGSCVWDLVNILTLLKVLQLPLFFKYLSNYLTEKYNSTDYSIRIIRNIFTFIFCYHFAVCFHFLVLRIFSSSHDDIGFLTASNVKSSVIEKRFWGDTNDVEKYIVCFYYTSHTLTLFANSIEERSQVDMVVSILFTLIGFMLHIWLVAEAYMYLTTSYGPSLDFQEIRYQLQIYIAFKHIPKSIQTRILTYYDYSFKNKFYRKDEILGLLGGELRQTIAVEICLPHLLRSYLFRFLPENILKAFSRSMLEAMYLKDDVISRNDHNRGQKLFFIVYGTVAVYTESGSEIAHLHDGNMFGETEFLQYRESSEYMNYVAVEECAILVLMRSDFMRIMAEKTELINHMRTLVSDENFNGTLFDDTSSNGMQEK